MRAVLVGFGLLACVAACGDSERVTADKAAITISQTNWVAAYNENDWQALSQHFTQDALLMPPGDVILMGRDAIADWEAANEMGYQIRLDIDAIDVSGDIAAVYGTSCLTIPTQGGLLFDKGKFVEVRKRGKNGEWLIAADIFNSDGIEGLTSC